MIKQALVFLLLAGFLLAGCSSAGDSGPVELAITAQDIAYSTQELAAVAGRPVKLIMRNGAALEHDFTITSMPHTGEVMSEGLEDEAMGHDMATTPDVHVSVAPGGEGLLEFTPAEPGSYEYFCSVPGHKEAGMVGDLAVTAD